MGTTQSVPTIGTLAGLAGALTGAIGAAVAGGEMLIDYATLGVVRTHLANARDRLVEAQDAMASIPLSAVGGSPAGKLLSHHSKLAHERLLETIAEMEAGLANYDSAMVTTQKEVIGSDEVSHSDQTQVHTNLESGTTCTGGPTTTAPLPQCGP